MIEVLACQLGSYSATLLLPPYTLSICLSIVSKQIFDRSQVLKGREEGSWGKYFVSGVEFKYCNLLNDKHENERVRIRVLCKTRSIFPHIRNIRI